MPIIERFKSASLPKKIIIIAIILLLLLMLGLLVYLLLTKYTKAPLNANVNANINQNVNNNTLANLNVQISSTYLAPESLNQEKETQQKEKSALLVASSFVERYGSFSNQSDFANLTDLMPFMTDSFKTYVNGLITKTKAQNAAATEYYGIETRVVSSDVQKLDDASAEIMFTTQRSEFKNTTTNPRIFYQDILIKLTKQGQQWLISGAYWQ